jgi:hypothetical protein
MFVISFLLQACLMATASPILRSSLSAELKQNKEQNKALLSNSKSKRKSNSNSNSINHNHNHNHNNLLELNVSIRSRARVVGIMNVIDLIIGTGLSAAAWKVDQNTLKSEKKHIQQNVESENHNIIKTAIHETNKMLLHMKNWLEMLHFQVATKADVALRLLLSTRPDIEDETDGPIKRLKHHLEALSKKGYMNSRASKKEEEKEGVVATEGVAQGVDSESEEDKALNKAWNDSLKEIIYSLPEQFSEMKKNIIDWWNSLKSPKARDELFGSLFKGQITTQLVHAIVIHLVAILIPLLHTVVGMQALMKSVTKSFTINQRCKKYIDLLNTRNRGKMAILV